MLISYFKLRLKKTMSSKLRITAGSLKGRHIFWNSKHIRPTPCMMRQRLFNWLQFDIRNKRCLDLFAGTGMLGIEALSRGAAHVTFIDEHHEACKDIEQNLINLKVTSYRVLNQKIPTQLDIKADYIFCDPPYDLTASESLLNWMDSHFKGAILYFECRKPPAFPDHWHITKTAKQGQCLAYLIQIPDA